MELQTRSVVLFGLMLILLEEIKTQPDKCCDLGKNWGREGLKCEKFSGPVSGVPEDEQEFCLQGVNVCCIREYREKGCQQGKDDARAGKGCNSPGENKSSAFVEDYRKNCCDGCKLGIQRGSRGQGCALKYSLGNPWDPAFLECCHEASPTTISTESNETSSTYDSTKATDTSSVATINENEITGSLTTKPSSSSPQASLDDICQVMRGMLCTEICVPTPGSFYCLCNEGSTLLEDGRTCKQNSTVDRCNTESNPCEQNCTDTGLAVLCSCDEGYQLANDNHSCTPITTEMGNSTTRYEENETTPRCPAGYRYNSKNQACDDMDECEENPCSGECQNTIGSYLCVFEKQEKPNIDSTAQDKGQSCQPGFYWDKGTENCVDIDECEEISGVCSEDGHICVNMQGSFICHKSQNATDCPSGFKFHLENNKCLDIDECAEGLSNCMPEVEICKNNEGSYDCEIICQKGYAFNANLSSCVDIDECLEMKNSCPNTESLCLNTIGSFECINANENQGFVITKNQDINSQNEIICTLGYKPSAIGDSCLDIDECGENIHSCEANEKCVNDPGSYRCESSLEAPKEKINFQEAEVKQNEINKNDTDLKSKDEDLCPPGFSFSNETMNCKDIDECISGWTACGIGERCRNLIGGYDCIPTCNRGFVFENETCQDINECTLNLHSCFDRTHRCVNTNGSYACEPKEKAIGQKFRPRNCERGFKQNTETGKCVDIDECLEGPGCRDHERCFNTFGSFDCSPLCTTGWYFDPSIKGCRDVDECLLGRHYCKQGTEICENTNGSYVCNPAPHCGRGFRRIFNGSCLDVDECAENLHSCSLELHRYCVNREGSYECVTRLPSCSPGYEYSLYTRHCEDIDECLIGKYNCDTRLSERCVNLPGSYRCERPPPSIKSLQRRPACPQGYRYHPIWRRCSDVDECVEGSHSCGREVCYNQPGGYSCAKHPTPITRRTAPPFTSSVSAAFTKACADGMKYEKNQGCVDINECKEIEDACSSNENCVNSIGSFDCKCRTGYRRDNLTQACVDINECQLKLDNCLPTQRCDNTLGSFACVRFLSCGTGYTLNAATEICEDDDECALGSHNCVDGYFCRNTLGSFRCYKVRGNVTTTQRPTTIRRLPSRYPVRTTTPRITSKTTPMITKPITVVTTQAMKSTTTERIISKSTSPLQTNKNPETRPKIQCPKGYENGKSGQCIDVDECKLIPNPCSKRSMQMCINTMGSYRCEPRIMCGPGYQPDPKTGRYCVDVDECAENIHECSKGQTCENRQGGYACICPPGHTVVSNRDCVDVDECSIYGDKLCGSGGRCENTVGSFHCKCETGFENSARAGGSCQDIDECATIQGVCQHTCSNTWGSFRCGCKPGYRLNSDNKTCSDIDECMEFKENNLCIGMCDNTPGSYKCQCPEGYRLGEDGRTCQDNDECSMGQVCGNSNEMCQNTRGGYRCNKIDCPSGYYLDNEKKNRCVKASRYCQITDQACLRQPSHYSYNFITFVSNLPMPRSGQLELFTMRGTHLPGSSLQFSMSFIEARAPPGVIRATESCFAMRRPAPSQVVLALVKSIQGPQEIELDLSMEIYHDAMFVGSAVAKIFIFVSQYEF
ncbi:fibrillin-1-like [Leptopilina heterotoma]|uniref:fibrillin-1-like n=1 Tax=Leptopilina heterotoma TaxID=63436 RepID=UPI001CA7FA6E|nr:fibrillin-1-like [Leptopilina heterotoma]